MSKHFSRNEACQRLSDQVDRRARTPWAQGPKGMRRDRHLFPRDVRAVAQSIKTGLGTKIEEDAETNPQAPNGVTTLKKRRLMEHGDGLLRRPQVVKKKELARFTKNLSHQPAPCVMSLQIEVLRSR